MPSCPCPSSLVYEYVLSCYSLLRGERVCVWAKESALLFIKIIMESNNTNKNKASFSLWKRLLSTHRLYSMGDFYCILCFFISPGILWIATARERECENIQLLLDVFFCVALRMVFYNWWEMVIYGQCTKQGGKWISCGG